MMEVAQNLEFASGIFCQNFDDMYEATIHNAITSENSPPEFHIDDVKKGNGSSRCSSGTSSPSPPPPLLPPCRICGEKASGFHYGVNTCEACKGFFRRSLRRVAGYKCTNQGRCEILPGKRSSCAACRLAKCLALGMSKSAIKTGRYTHAKRAKDTYEVKYRSTMNEEGLPIKMFEKEPEQPNLVDDMIDTSTEHGQIIQVLTAAYIGATTYTAEYMAKLPLREAKYLERVAYKEKIFGSMRPLNQEEYKQIYKATGIDVDGRRQLLLNILPCLERSIKKFIDFAKMLPGFKTLPIEDQVSLIKASRFDCWMLAVHKATNCEKRLFTNTANETIGAAEMMKIDDKGFVDDFFRLATIIKRLRLKPTEIALLQGICVLFRDRCDLKAPEDVERCQDRIVTALIVYLKHTYPKDPLRLARLFGAITELRCKQAGISNVPIGDDIFGRDDVQFPPLVLEMWST